MGSKIWAVQYTAALVFGFGVVVQCLVMLRSNLKDPKVLLQFGGVALIALIALLPGKNEREYILYNHMVFYFILFAMSYAVLFKRLILPHIDERVLLVINILFIHRFFVVLLPLQAQYLWFVSGSVTLLIATATAAVILNAMIPQKPPRWLKIAFYAWYMIMSAGIIILTFPCGDFFKILQADAVTTLDMIELVTSGMTLVFLSMNVLNAFLLLPIPGKGQSWDNRMIELREHIDTLNEKYCDEQLHPIQTLLLIAGCLALIAMQVFFFSTRVSLMTNIGMLAVYFVFGQLTVLRKDIKRR